MYLFARRARIAPGQGRDAVEWTLEICTKARAVSGLDVEVWANAYSEGFGGVSWTAWVPDLATLEKATDALEADDGYQKLVAKGGTFLAGGADDRLMQPIHGQPDPDRELHYVWGVEAVCAAGNFHRAMTAGVEIAQMAEQITGVPTLFGRRLTGPYGSVGWLSGHADLAGYQHADEALVNDPGWADFIDSTEGCFVEAPSMTESTLYRKIS